MELTYLTPEIRTATNDGEAARTMLGEDLARSFRGLVADMRNAMYLGEVPDQPAVCVREGRFGLNYALGHFAVLEVEPVAAGALDGGNWGDVHRVKLLRIVDNGKVLA